MSSLPFFKDDNQQFMLLQTRWASQLNPILAIPFLSGRAVNNVALIVGSTTINHGLQRMQQGWVITDRNRGGDIYRALPFNQTTLTLSAGQAQTISVWCF